MEMIMKKHGFVFATLSLLALSSFSAEAACRKSYVCNDFGQQCSYRDICDSTLDLPSTNLAPLPPLPTTRLKPLPSIGLPPLGTTKCEYKQVNGRWQNVCE
jgi:hypothetical protein